MLCVCVDEKQELKFVCRCTAKRQYLLVIDNCQTRPCPVSVRRKVRGTHSSGEGFKMLLCSHGFDLGVLQSQVAFEQVFLWLMVGSMEDYLRRHGV